MSNNDTAAALLAEQMAAAIRGDKTAYDSVLRAISAYLTNYLRKKLSPKDLEDVLQEILLSVHKARHTYDTSRPLMPWVMAIARFRLNDFWRQHYGHGFNEMADIEGLKEILGTDVTESMQNREDIRRVIKTLPPKQQQILTLMYAEDKNVQEVASAMGMSVSAVKVAAHRSYKVFRKCMKV
jgi:RNA polymerase sigma-70 factor, ECF subfamily